MPNIPRVVRKSTPTLLEESKANEVIDAINSLMDSEGERGIAVTVDSEGKLTISTDITAGDGINITSESDTDLTIELSNLINVILCRNGQPVNGRIPFLPPSN